MNTPFTILDVGAGHPREDLARELRLMEEAVQEGPRLFFYSWPSPVVVLGYGQPESDVDLAFCREHAIPVFKRASGGTGVLHCGDLAVSLALPMSHPAAGGIQRLYDFMTSRLREALDKEGIQTAAHIADSKAQKRRSPLCFLDQDSETLLLEGKKCVGCSQARKKDAVMVHATLLLNLDLPLTSRIFRIPETRITRSLAPLPLPANHIADFKARVAEHIRSAL